LTQNVHYGGHAVKVLQNLTTHAVDWKPAVRLVKFTVAVMMIGAFPGGTLYAKHWNVVLLHDAQLCQ
jgi:uncharacterized membrane protein YfcA